MKGIALVTIISIFSVVIPIQSRETVYTYNYDNFGDFFPQDDIEVFNITKYADNNTIFEQEYNGTNIGGAFLVKGSGDGVSQFEGYIVNITATFYCGSTNKEEGVNSLYIEVHYPRGYPEGIHLCKERGWHYNYTWTPSLARQLNFTVIAEADEATIHKAYGFDELRIITSDTPPQLLQRDNISSNVVPAL